MKNRTKNYLGKEMGKVHPAFETLDEYDPGLADAVASLREKALSRNQLPEKYRELIMVAVEVATGRGEKGKSHARKAVRAGASVKEIFETLTLCLYLVGMSSWVDGGWACVTAAEEEKAKIKKRLPFRWNED